MGSGRVLSKTLSGPYLWPWLKPREGVAERRSRGPGAVALSLRVFLKCILLHTHPYIHTRTRAFLQQYAGLSALELQHEVHLFSLLFSVQISPFCPQRVPPSYDHHCGSFFLLSSPFRFFFFGLILSHWHLTMKWMNVWTVCDVEMGKCIFTTCELFIPFLHHLSFCCESYFFFHPPPFHHQTAKITKRKKKISCN